MTHALRILLVEDSDDDAMLVGRHLARAGPVAIERVQTAERLRDACATSCWDAVISDYCMPRFDGIGAMRIVRERDAHVPFILVSATVPEQVAVAAMSEGANDFVMKHELPRLGPAVRREIAGARMRRRLRYLDATEGRGDAAERADLERRLDGAIERGEFALHYQPKIDLATGAVSGVEALLRWRDETGCALRVAVNVSASQLHSADFIPALEAILARFDDPRLDIEITESVLVRDLEACARKLAVIARMGIGISIDDFGTGYSSLAYMARLPVSAIKIDRAFIGDAATGGRGRSIVMAIATLARSLALETVAEGVETSDQLEAVRLAGCTHVQGFHTGRPMPFEEVAALLR